MFNLIFQKELRDNLLNLRFVVACLVSITVTVVTIVTLTSSYKLELADHNGRQITQEEFISHYGHLNRWGWMSKPMRAPAHYAFLIVGLDREAEQANFVSDPLPVLFTQMDLVGIVTIIMSLMAILFSYNAITGEREAGLLKQMLSTQVSRGTILIGKFLGGSISLLIPFTIGLLAGLVYAALNPDIQLQTVDFGVFVLLLLGSFLYISSFYALGLLFSARSQSSNVSVLKSLFAWVILVLVHPNVSPFLAAEIYRIPSKTQIDMQTWELQGRERDNIISQHTKEMYRTTYADLAPELQDLSDFVKNDKLMKKAEQDPKFKERYSQFNKEWIEMVNRVNDEQAAKIKIVREQFEKRSKHQEWLARMFASVSPLADFVFISTDLAEAGIQADDAWTEQTEQFSNDLSPLLRKKYDDEVKRNPTFTFNDLIDMRDVPRFQYHSPGISEKLDSALPHFGLLMIYNLLFIAGAWVSFLRYDVR